MPAGQKRSYQSAVRKRQAAETRQRIAAAGRRLLVAKGYAAMTIDAIARDAGRGGANRLCRVWLESRHSERKFWIKPASTRPIRISFVMLRALVNLMKGCVTPRASLAGFSTPNGRSLDLLRGAGVLAPELSRVERERESMRYDRQEPLIEYLAKKKHLRPGIGKARAREILWALTSRDLYRMLVRERGWSSQEFEEWLGRTLVEALLG